MFPAGSGVSAPENFPFPFWLCDYAPGVTRAFVLGAGLGTRLRPLTNQLPKPLIPVRHRPLAEYAFLHLHGAGAREFVVNTHHLPEEWTNTFPSGHWRGCPVRFRHEPVLLETGGGLANIRDLMGDEPFFVYNGDVLTSLPLAPALAAHKGSGNLATLVLRSSGGVRNVAMRSDEGRVVDLRGTLGITDVPLFLFTGLYIVEPALYRYLPERGVIESVVEAWLRALRAGARIGGVVVDDGEWFDLGDRASYLAAHQWAGLAAEPAIHPGAVIQAGALVDARSYIGPGAVVESGAVVRGSIIWPGAVVRSGAQLDGCIVLRGHTAEGTQHGTDI